MLDMEMGSIPGVVSTGSVLVNVNAIVAPIKTAYNTPGIDPISMSNMGVPLSTLQQNYQVPQVVRQVWIWAILPVQAWHGNPIV